MKRLKSAAKYSTEQAARIGGSGPEIAGTSSGTGRLFGG
jgi:hypothetical protein